MSYVILPFEGLSEITFGMTSKEVKKILGKPVLIEIDDIMEEIRETSSGMVLTYIEKRLSDIEISPSVEATVFDTDLFKHTAINDLLKTHSKDFLEYREYVNFRDLGIITCGFNKHKTKNKKQVTIYSKDRVPFYDSFMNVFI